ncbi:MAG: peptidoglycan editing factor PgeF [Rhizobiaceae bacterium]|nr:peptidoglycan editing factor PgeF [Rhizobiaceae bacterium]MCV0408559.1 peptidoglycan editing factor PgeF [Rhizobiaceae bacterium]
MLQSAKPEPLRSQLIDRALKNGVRHGFFTRHGGVSRGIYASLNTGIGSKDDPALVSENRRRVAMAMGVDESMLVTPYQIHSAEAVVVDGPFPGERVKADGIVTATPGVAIGVGTADCGPILFADGEARVVGAAHAGWKGALTGVLEATIEAMEGLGAKRERIVAALGPSIRGESYEVGPEFVRRWLEADEENQRWFSPSAREGHAMFDLPGYTIERLRRAGVQAEQLGRCTYKEEDLFFSYRRTTHLNEPDYGRQISAIMLEAM